VKPVTSLRGFAQHDFEVYDMTDVISLSETQFQKILTALESLKSGGMHWEIFLSALLAMIVGMIIELVRWNHEKAKSAKERNKKEVEQINVAFVGIVYNIQMLLHAVFQHFIPHYDDSHGAYKELHETNGNEERINQFLSTFDKYRAIMTTAPEMYFIELDFLDRLPFIVEKDPELLKQTSWIVCLLRILKNAILERNKLIEIANNLVTQHKGKLNLYELGSILQRQESLSESECATALQLIEHFLSVAKSLENLNKTYNIPSSQLKFPRPKALDDAISKLRERAAAYIQKMPAT